MLLELIKYAGSGIIPFLSTISIIAIPCWAITDLIQIRITIDKKDRTATIDPELRNQNKEDNIDE